MEANAPTEPDADIGEDAIATAEAESEVSPENTEQEIKLIHDDGA